MISDNEEKIIREISERYDVKRVLLFGSSLASERESRDIDLAVEGISPGYFFKFYGGLLFRLTKPVDIVNLSGTSKFIKMIKQEGIPIYG